MQEYLLPENVYSVQMTKFIFQAKTRMIDVRCNFKNKYTKEDRKCPFGCAVLDFMVDDSLELPLVWSMAVAWLALWNLRQKKTRPQLYLVRAEMEAKVALLRECRKFSNDVALIDTIIGTL